MPFLSKGLEQSQISVSMEGRGINPPGTAMQPAWVSQVDAFLANESAMGTARIKDVWQGLLVNPSGGKDVGSDNSSCQSTMAFECGTQRKVGGGHPGGLLKLPDYLQHMPSFFVISHIRRLPLLDITPPRQRRYAAASQACLGPRWANL